MYHEFRGYRQNLPTGQQFTAPAADELRLYCEWLFHYHHELFPEDGVHNMDRWGGSTPSSLRASIFHTTALETMWQF